MLYQIFRPIAKTQSIENSRLIMRFVKRWSVEDDEELELDMHSSERSVGCEYV